MSTHLSIYLTLSHNCFRSHGLLFSIPSGETFVGFPRVLAFCVDYGEAAGLMVVKWLKCPHCYGIDDYSDFDAPRTLRTSLEMEKLFTDVQIGRETPNALDQVGLSGQVNFAWQFRGIMDIYDCLSSDRLHVIDKGVFETLLDALEIYWKSNNVAKRRKNEFNKTYVLLFFTCAIILFFDLI